MQHELMLFGPAASRMQECNQRRARTSNSCSGVRAQGIEPSGRRKITDPGTVLEPAGPLRESPSRWGPAGVNLARPAHVFTVDLEDWYHGLEVDMDGWNRFAPRIEKGMGVLLDLFSQAGITATFFVLGRQAEQTPQLVREVADGGHEIACHGYSHRFVYRQEPHQFRAELHRAKQMLEQITGGPVHGYRAPFFSITEQSLWALDILIDEGFTYDSSLFPVLNYRYGVPGAARMPGPVSTPSGRAIFEIPLSTLRLPHRSLPIGVNIPISGGGYFRLYPYRLTWAFVKLLEREGAGLVFYVHPWEFDADHPRIRMPHAIAQLTHYLNLPRMADRTRRLLSDFTFVSIREAYGDRISRGR
jgi:polysaccharide deacetylase family protein (PEP-CTERM system associated)